MSGGTRLDRLILLLESGSTPSVRLTAARQLGSIAGTRVSHPTTRTSEVKSEDAGVIVETSNSWRGVEGEWNEVIGLVARVLPHLQSKSFETRQAAATALSHVSRAVGVWDPSSTAPPINSVDVSPEEEQDSEDYLTLESFNLIKMLEEGRLLLSSSGNEFAKISNLSAEELAKAQKDALGKLGLGEGDELGVDMEAELAGGTEGGLINREKSSTIPNLSSSESLLTTPFTLPPPKFRNDASGSTRLSPLPSLSTSYTSAPVSQPLPTSEPIVIPASEVIAPDATLSARERNKLKRKLKSEGKGGRAPSPTLVAPPAKKIKSVESDPSITSASTSLVTTPLPEVKVETEEVANLTGVAGEVVIIDPGAKSREGGEIKAQEGQFLKKETEVVVGEWPWRKTVEKLASGLHSSKWETRHGAALGLKEILRLQGSGGGQIAGLSLAINFKRHQQWCDALSAKILCVFALDRFGDYISDQTIAPVRETAAQALATLLPYMPTSSVQSVQQILIAMIDQNGAPPSIGLDVKYDSKLTNKTASTASRKGQYAWQVRHSGLLGLKYLVAVKGQLLRRVEDSVKFEVSTGGDVAMASTTDTVMLKGIVDAALIGLRDRDDDVRSAAAATLTPIADALVLQLPHELQLVIEVLWDCLADLQDDLSSSIGGVMDLLAKLLVFPSVLSLMQSSALGTSLSDLIPRLFPFFRHTISSVRLAVLNTTLVFLQLPSIDHSWADSRLLRLLFQNFVVEERLEIRNATMAAWKECLQFAQTDSGRLNRDAVPFIQAWFSILMTPVGIAIQPAYFWSAKVSLSGQGGYVHNVDKAMLAQDLSLVSMESIMRCRVAGASALGALICIWPESGRQLVFGKLLLGSDGLASTSSFKRFLSATIIEELATALISINNTSVLLSSPFTDTLSKDLVTLLQAGPPSEYDEMGLIIQRIQADCQALYTAIASQGKLSPTLIPTLPTSFKIQDANQVVESFPKLLARFDEASRKRHHTTLEARLRKLTTAIGYYETTKSNRDRQVNSALGGGVIALGVLPQKLTPLIQSITNSLKREEDVDLQARSARSIAAFIDINSANSPIPEAGKPTKPRPSDKLVKNLCTFLCQDVSRTPIFADIKSSKRGILTLEYRPARGLALKEIKEVVESDEILAARLVYRGAQLALSELALRFGSNLLDRVPKLWSCMSEVLLQVFSSGDIKTADSLLANDDNLGQDLLDCLTVLPTGASKLGERLHIRLVELFPALALASHSRYAVVRYAVARCFASLCDILPVEGLRHLVEVVIPVMGDPINVNNRRGAVELVSHIVELLDIKILPYVIFLVVPVLGRMSDSDDDVRLVATNTFATLIKLVPLEAGLPDPPGFSADLLAKRQAEREFLTQLLDGSKVEEYQIPIPIAIELRKYQRDGVSWLAFLAKYQLHGLLCDDMGLGKTLQSICILASKHFERSEIHRSTKSLDSVHLPSLVVCPPTLTGHWKHEIKTYASNLKCLIYTGARAEREKLVSSLSKYDVVIMSYDIVRNDIDSLGQQDWHYCILDEGHIIKNGQTKLTKAVKSLRAIHRLILSGTPIQNNVLELWSLFDFLMPGFLGSEKAFNTRFGKPIAASRDAKSSSKEQEAGALALEALHKQVLPFLLRRLKEDVLDDLPPKIIQDYYCELSPLQKQLYDDFSTSQAKQAVDGEISSGSGAGKPQHVFQALQYLRKLVNHPVLVMKPELPQHQAIMAKIEKTGGSIRDVGNAPKLQALRQILLDCGIGTSPAENDTSIDAVSQHRVLIFCQLKQMLDIIENDLFKTLMPSVTYMRMDGGTDVSKRHAVVQTFNGDPSIDCLLLTTHVGGLGLNLTGADTVIFVEHDWNPMKDLQAMDRAHRLGQKKVVNVYRLIMRGTLEEKIMGLQRFKLNIASSVVTQQNSDLSSLGTDQILDLFNVSAVDAPAIVSKDRPSGQKAILEGLGDLQAEDEYKDLDFDSFTSSL